MTYKDTHPIDSYWNTDIKLPINTYRGKYIAINGNTASGKSTLINTIRYLSQNHSIKLKCINERVLHHPLMKLQFHQPKDYAYLLQLNFMIQRRLLLKRWLELGYHVIVERCHLDDRMFMDLHLQEDNITIAAYEAFSLLDQTNELQLPDPDYYIFLDVPTDVAFGRLQNSETAAERPKEFPSIEAQKELIGKWNRMYSSYYERLLDEKQKGTRCKTTSFLKWSAIQESHEMAQKTLSFLI
ncbi:MAG: deoxynucleoside kinase [Chitinophagales bacterium]